MKYKDDDPNPLLDIKIFSSLVMAKWKRQLCWLMGRYKLIFLFFAFSLCIWGLVRGPSEVAEPKTLEHFELQHGGKKVKEIPDFDYKYDDDKKVNDVLEGGGDGDTRNVKESVHNYILSQREKIKSVNDDIKQALLLSNDVEEEAPKVDLQRSSGRLKAKPTRRNKNSINGVDIDVSDTGENLLRGAVLPFMELYCQVTPELLYKFI